jgi:sulfur carrier protein ThiS adenylyltransferase
MTTEAFYDNLIKKMGRDNFKKVQSARIGIAGAGGLGSNCAANLVRTGFQKLIIADFDRIDAGNLDRQFYFLDQVGMDKVEALKVNLSRINPALELKIIKKRIEKDNIRELFSDCDVVAECLDTARYKKILLEELLIMKKFVVAVSGLGGIGSSDEIKTRRIKDNFVMIGDLASDVCRQGALSPRVNIASAKQADIILEHVLKTRGEDPQNNS